MFKWKAYKNKFHHGTYRFRILRYVAASYSKPNVAHFRKQFLPLTLKNQVILLTTFPCTNV